MIGLRQLSYLMGKLRETNPLCTMEDLVHNLEKGLQTNQVACLRCSSPLEHGNNTSCCTWCDGLVISVFCESETPEVCDLCKIGWRTLPRPRFCQGCTIDIVGGESAVKELFPQYQGHPNATRLIGEKLNLYCCVIRHKSMTLQELPVAEQVPVESLVKFIDSHDVTSPVNASALNN